VLAKYHGSGASIISSCAVDNENNYGTITASGSTFTVNAPTGCTAFEGQRLRLHLNFTISQTYPLNSVFVRGSTALRTSSIPGQ
jgi:hypothetical protein